MSKFKNNTLIMDTNSSKNSESISNTNSTNPTSTSSFLKTENFEKFKMFDSDLKKSDGIISEKDLNDDFDVIISKYSIIKNKLNNLWNKLD